LTDAQGAFRSRSDRYDPHVSTIADQLSELGLVLPPPLTAPPGVVLPFSPVVVRGDRAVVSGHGPQEPDGSLARPLGKVGADLTAEQGYHAARLTALAVLGSLERAIGDLDRITGWTRVFGMVNAAPGFTALPGVINGFSDLVIEVFGDQVGAHSRSAVGLAELPFSIPVEVECEVEIR
jgi:enamine deaminase RidA (YjgF/YER057c/UK114 family)